MACMSEEVQGWRRWVPVLVGMGLTAVVFWFAQPALLSPRGAIGPTVLLSERPMVAIGALAVCFAMASVVAIVLGKLVNAVTGLFVLGWGLAVLTMRCATMVEVAFTPDKPAGMIVVESLLWGAVVLGLVVVVLRVVGIPGDFEANPDNPGSHKLLSMESLKAAAAGLIIIPAIWIVAQSEMKGQAFGAAVAGGIAAGLVGRLVSPYGSPVLLYVSLCVFGAVGHVIGLASTAKPLADAFVMDAVSPFLLVSPLDLAAGSLLGVSVGLGWAKSFLHHQPAAATT